jgi:four helix bundle protein
MQEQELSNTETGRFEFQKWPAYQMALPNVESAYAVCESLPKDSATGLRDQLKRAAQSISLNIAEGTSRYSLKDKVNFFRVAKGSIFECVAILDIVHRLKLTRLELEQFFKDLETTGRMLSGLIRHLEGRKTGS